MTDRPSASSDHDTQGRPPDRADHGSSHRHSHFESGDGSHRPGPPRFVAVGDGIANPNGNEMETRDDLAPWNPDGQGEYAWTVVDTPAGSTAEPTDGPVAEFEPDVPGEYALELEAPDGEHELTVRAFPEVDADDPRPRVSLDATIEDDRDRIRLSATAEIAGRSAADLEIEYYVDDRDDAEITSDGTIPIENGFELDVDGERFTIGGTGAFLEDFEAETVTLQPIDE